MPYLPPTPDVDIRVCGDSVCISPEDTVTLARWIHQAKEVEIALAGCSLVERL